MHKKIIETALSRLDGERAAYFGDVGRRLEEDPRAQPNASIVYTVLKDVTAELPIYLDKVELIDLLLKFTGGNYQRRHQIMFYREFVHDLTSIRAVTGNFILQGVDISLEKTTPVTHPTASTS